MEGCTPPRSPVQSGPRTADWDRITKQGHCSCDWSGRGQTGAGGPNPVLVKRGPRHGSGGRPGRRRQRWGCSRQPGPPSVAGSTGSWETDEEGSPSAGTSAADTPAPGESAFLSLTPQSVDLPSAAQDADVPATWTLPVSGRATVTRTHVVLGPAGASPAPLTRPWSPSLPWRAGRPACPT